MDALEFFALRYDNVHTVLTSRLLDGLTDEQLRQRPHGVNSIAWLLWHLARCEDVIPTPGEHWGIPQAAWGHQW